MGKQITTVLMVCAWVALSGPALAQDKPHTHDGFYLRLTTGVGYGSQKNDDEDVEMSGLSGLTTLGIGGSVSDNLILNADLFGLRMIEPTVDYKGKTQRKLKVEVSIYGLGLGMTYYIMPVNIYITGSAGMAIREEKDGFGKRQSDPGYGINFAIGKEWWVSPSWGIGVAGQFLFADVEETKTFGGGLLFTATYH
jgi:hypothetical protein